MGSALGSLVVQLALKYAEYTQGLSKSEQDTKRFAKGVQDAMDGAEKAASNFFKGLVTGAAGAVAAYLSVQFAAGQFNKAVADLSSMQGVAEAIGTTAAKVSGLEEPLKRAGMGMTDLRAIGSKLSKALLDARDPASEAAKAFKSIGVDPKNFTDSTDALVAVSRAMVGFKDDANKTQVAMQLLGKSGAETIGLFNEIAGAQDLSAKATEAQIRAADDFRKNVASIGLDFDNLSRQVAGGLLPLFNELAEPIRDGLQAAARGVAEWFARNEVYVKNLWDDLKGVGRAALDILGFVGRIVLAVGDWLVKSGTISAALRVVRLAVAGIEDGFWLVAGVVAKVGAWIGDLLIAPASRFIGLMGTVAEAFGLSWASSLKAAQASLDGLTAGAHKFADDAIARVANNSAVMKLTAEFGLANDAVLAFENGTTKAGDSTEKAGKQLEDARRSVNAFGKDSDEAAKAAAKLDENLEKVMQQLAEREAQLKADINSEAKLTDVQKLQVKILADLASGALKVKAGKEEQIKAALKSLLALEKENKELDDNDEHLKRTRAENLKSAEALQNKTLALEDQVKAAVEEGKQIGLSADALARLEIARNRDAAASLRQRAAALDANGVMVDVSAEYKRQADLLEKLADQKAANAAKQTQVDLAKAAEEEWKRASESISNSLTDALMRGFESGKGFLRNLIDTTKNLFQTLVLRPIIQAVVVGGVNAAASSIAGATGSSLVGSAATNVAGSYLSSAVTSYLGSASYAAAVPGLTSFAAGSQAAMLAAQTGEFGVAGLSATAAAGGSTALSAVAAAAPYIAAITAIYSLLSRGGETRSGGQYGLRDGRAYLIEGPSGGDPAAAATMQAIEGAQESIYALARSLGGSGGGQITRAGYEYSKYHYRRFTELFVDGVGRRQYGETTDFSNEAVAQQFSDDLTRALLLGLQGAQLDRPFAEYFAQFDDVFAMTAEQVSNAIDTANAAKAMADSVKLLGGVFSQFNGISVEARMRIAELTGGMEAFTQKVGGYVQNYYTEQEQLAIAASQISSALRDANVNGDWLSSREQFRWLVDSLNLSSGVGPEQLAGLLNVADSFASIADQLAESGMTLGEAAAGVPESVARLLDQTSANDVIAQRNQDSALAFESSANLFSAATTNFAARMDSVAERFERVSEEMRIAGFGAEVSG